MYLFGRENGEEDARDVIYSKCCSKTKILRAPPSLVPSFYYNRFRSTLAFFLTILYMPPCILCCTFGSLPVSTTLKVIFLPSYHLLLHIKKSTTFFLVFSSVLRCCIFCATHKSEFVPRNTNVLGTTRVLACNLPHYTYILR